MRWRILPASVFATAVLGFTACWRQPYDEPPWELRHMMVDGYGGGMMWILLLILIGLALYLAVRLARDRGGRPPAVETPLEILKKRYAKGEIDREEYERIKADIEN